MLIFYAGIYAGRKANKSGGKAASYVEEEY